MDPELIAPCGINCAACVAFFGYTMAGGKRKHKCTGCRISNKNCAFLKKKCKALREGDVMFCFQCDTFPCEHLEKLETRYNEKYDTSLISNLEFIREKGMDAFLELEAARWKCPACGGIRCMHTSKCYNCD